MSTIKPNLIAVTAIAILTGQCTSMANGVTLHPASGGVIRLHNDPGGLIRTYRDRFIQARDNGERVVIDGICLSACTLAVGICMIIQRLTSRSWMAALQQAWTIWDGRGKGHSRPNVAAAGPRCGGRAERSNQTAAGQTGAARAGRLRGSRRSRTVSCAYGNSGFG